MAKDDDGKDHLVLTGLDRLDEPASLTALRAGIDARMPIVDLPEALLEVHSWTGCLDHFTHVSTDAPSRKQDMITSMSPSWSAPIGQDWPGQTYSLNECDTKPG
ncbi:hypothetical protein E1294_04570 [Nonomuraea diastatica]|uniref:Uncharacterized protein n=1 Tax=Nonomuraea diastatica TaxID=1848329 RepID=A0A4R4X388_9ACTN|nr:hypothetical protein E1294_04570 [Nonomuraea diastatica]